MKLTPLGASFLATVGCTTAGQLDTGGARLTQELQQLRDATRAFHVLDSAVAAGYPRTVRNCLVHQHHGAMGFHHLNAALLDAEARIEKPEILLYELTGDGRYVLNGVEFIVPYTFRARDSVPPVLMGQSLRREDNLRFWYLHVWAWKENPDGPFADFHPAVSCPDSARRVFIPSAESAR